MSENSKLYFNVQYIAWRSRYYNIYRWSRRKSDVVREKVCESLKCLGVELDRSANDKLKGEFRKISTVNSKIDVFVVPTDEELMIAKRYV